MTLGVTLGVVSPFPICVFPASPVSSVICKVGTWLSALAVLMGVIAGGQGRPLFVVKLPDEQATGQLSTQLPPILPPSPSSSSAQEAWLLTR